MRGSSVVQKKGIQPLSPISPFNLCGADSLLHCTIESFNGGISLGPIGGDFAVVYTIGREEVLDLSRN
jgi:hypothetical protein